MGFTIVERLHASRGAFCELFDLIRQFLKFLDCHGAKHSLPEGFAVPNGSRTKVGGRCPKTVKMSRIGTAVPNGFQNQ